MKNGLGAISKALDLLEQAAREDDIPILDVEQATLIIAESRSALDDVRTLARATRTLYAETIAPIDGEAPSPEAQDVLNALDALTAPRALV